MELRRAAHRSAASVTAAIDKLRFNVAIAHIYELANALSAALNAAGEKPGPGPAIRPARGRGNAHPNRRPNGAASS